jgi:kynureninase
MKKEEIFRNAEEMDRLDDLREFRSLFRHADERLIYFDGNSLGMAPVATIDHINHVVEREWGDRLIRSYNEKWWNMPSALGAAIAPLIGACPDEVIVCDSVSVNMFKILAGVLNNSGNKKVIVSDEMNFGTDLYIVQGLIDLLGRGHQLRLMKSKDGITIEDDEIDRCLDRDTAVLSLSYVSFRSSFMYDMKRITDKAHAVSSYVLWDLCHAVGAVPIDLNGAGADFAVGCTYKYLNGGPGATSFLYVRRDLRDKIQSPVWGWWADADPFSFNTAFRASEGMKKYLAGSVPVLSSSTLKTSLDIFRLAGMDRIRKKSIGMSTFFLGLAEEYLLPLGFSHGSPGDPAKRGSHISLRHPEAFRICRALTDENEGSYTIIPDFRSPDNIRIGFSPLYNTYMEIAILVSELVR